MPRNDEEHPGGPLAASVEKLRQELDHWMEAAVSQSERALGAFGIRGRHWFPAVDVIETGNDVLIEADLPGVAAEAVDVTLAGNMLTIKGSRPPRELGEHETAHSAERGSGEFTRSIPLPVPVNPDEVTAEVDNGVLHVRLVKADRAKSRQIRVSGGDQPRHPELA